MSQVLRLRRGSTADHNAFVGEEAEVTYDTDEKTIRVHDGQTVGGFPLYRAEDNPLVQGIGITRIQAIFKRDYDALALPDPETLYVIIPMRIVARPGSILYTGIDTQYLLNP